MAELIALKVGEEVVSGLVAQIKHNFNYLRNFHDNIANLSTKLKRLEDRQSDIQGKMESAKNNCQTIKQGVNDWLKEVGAKKGEAEAILSDKEKVGNGCWNGWCLNLSLRYKVSRRAVKKASDLDAFIAEGGFTEVAHPQQPLGIVPKTAGISSEIKASTSAGSANMGLQSRLLIVNDVIEVLKDNKVRIVRICGMGGIGKTTIAKEVRKIASADHLFDEIPMVEFNKEPDVRNVQLHLAQALGLILEEDSLSDRADRIRQRLTVEDKKILIILDNVWRREDVENVGIPLGDELNSRCKILLTSRQNTVCKNIATEQEFKIPVLLDPEASALFHQSLGNSPCYDQKAEELVKVCGGLPIAIKTIARAVANESENSWTVAIEELRRMSALKGEYLDVFDCLKVSYDFLQQKEIQKFFRLCCLFPKGVDVSIEDVTRYGMALRLFQDSDKLYKARNKAYHYVEKLLHANLWLESDKKGCIKCHDLVHDFAVSISSDDHDQFLVNHGNELKEWPLKDSYENYTAISLQCNGMFEVPEGMDCLNLKILHLTEDTYCPLLKFPDKFYEGISGLNVLSFRKLKVPLTQKSLQCLKNLRSLSLDLCDLEDNVSLIGCLVNLEILSFAGSTIMELPVEFGKLRRLKLLDLTSCRFLTTIVTGVLSSLTNLEELYMRDTDLCRGNKAQAVFNEIEPLSRLVAISVDIPLEALPMDSFFKKLKRFNIRIRKFKKRNWLGKLKFFLGTSVVEYLFPNSLELTCDSSVLLQNGIKKLVGEAEIMDLTVKGLATLPEDSETQGYINLKNLSLKSCYELVYLVHKSVLGKNNIVFQSMGSLHLQDLPSMEGIFPNVHISTPLWTRSAQRAPFCNLKVLTVDSCGKLDCVFNLSIARGLVMLERLEVRNCQNLQVIFAKGKGDEDKLTLPKLQYLSLERLPNLIGFCSDAVAFIFPGLEELKVTDCSELEYLFTPSTAICFEQLRSLEVNNCISLRAIVTAESADEVEECGEAVMLFPKLKVLNLLILPNLSTIAPKRFILKWTSIEILNAKFCGESDMFFAKICQVNGKVKPIE